MPTSRETIDYFLGQTAGAGSMRARSMFGEYARVHKRYYHCFRTQKMR